MTALKSVPTLLQGGIMTVRLIQKENEGRALPAAPAKQSTLLGAPPKQSTMPGAPILLLDISFL
jgi:hypothetical protein